VYGFETLKFLRPSPDKQKIPFLRPKKFIYIFQTASNSRSASPQWLPSTECVMMPALACAAPDIRVAAMKNLNPHPLEPTVWHSNKFGCRLAERFFVNRGEPRQQKLLERSSR
jgi:hypothetical protein